MDFESLMETASKNNKKSKKKIEKLPEEDEKIKAFSKNVGRSEKAKIEREAEEYAKKELKKKLALEKMRMEQAKADAAKKASSRPTETSSQKNSSTSVMSSKKKEAKPAGPAPDAIQAFLEKKKRIEEQKRKEEQKKREEIMKKRPDKKPRRSLQDARIRIATHEEKTPTPNSNSSKPLQTNHRKPEPTVEKKSSRPEIPSSSSHSEKKSKNPDEDKRVKKLNRPMPKSKKLKIMAEVLHDEFAAEKGKPKSKPIPKNLPPAEPPKSFHELMMMANDINKKTTLNDLNPDGSIKIKKPPPPKVSASSSKHLSSNSDLKHSSRPPGEKSHSKKRDIEPAQSSSSKSSASSQVPNPSSSSKPKTWGPKSKQLQAERNQSTSSSSAKKKSIDSAVPSTSKSQKPGPASSKRPLDPSSFEDDFEKFKRAKMAELKREFMEMQKKKAAARILHQRPSNDDEEDSDYDSDMDGFIDDSEEFGGQDQRELERTLKEAFNYDKKRFANEKYSKEDDKAMESNLWRMQAEEARSTKIAKQEDLQEWLREQKKLEKKKKRL